MACLYSCLSLNKYGTGIPHLAQLIIPIHCHAGQNYTKCESIFHNNTCHPLFVTKSFWILNLHAIPCLGRYMY